MFGYQKDYAFLKKQCLPGGTAFIQLKNHTIFFFVALLRPFESISTRVSNCYPCFKKYFFIVKKVRLSTPSVHPDQRYIDALLTNDRAVIEEIYRRFSGRIKSYILKNNGIEEDAADIFQETLIDLYQQAKSKNLILTCPFEPFLLLLCKRKWLNALKKKSILPVTNSEDSLLLNTSDDALREAEAVERRKEEAELYQNALQMISERCREIIKASLSTDAQEIIAEKMNVSYGYFRKKKSECMASLIKLIQEKK